MDYSDLPTHHADPFDRQIIAQALVESVPVVTPDEAFNLYEGLRSYGDCMHEQRLLTVGVERYAGHRGEQTPRTLILGDRRIAVVEVVDAWLAPEYRVLQTERRRRQCMSRSQDERSSNWDLTMFRAQNVSE